MYLGTFYKLDIIPLCSKELEECINAIDDGGFLLTTDDINESFTESDKLILCCEYQMENEKIQLLRKVNFI